jgi:hypothetical protein
MVALLRRATTLSNSKDGRWRQDKAKAEGQAAPSWGGQSQGQGRGPGPWKGKLNNARSTYREWMTLPLDTLVERKFLGMSLQQLELRRTSNIVHYVLNQEHTEDTLLTIN